MEGLHLLGCDDAVGLSFDSFAPLLQAAGGVAQGEIAEHERDEQKQKTAQAETKSASAAIDADQAASLAVAKAITSTKLKQPSADIDQTAAQQAVAAQDSAGMNLAPSACDKRAAAAKKALDDAIARAQKSPKDVYAQALVQAWQATLNKAQNRQIAAADSPRGKGKGGQSWWTRPVVGPIPGYGVVAGGAGILGAVGYAVKRFFF